MKSPSAPPKIILFDGVCGLCNGVVDFLMRVDRDHVFRFAPLQGSTATELRERHPSIPTDLSSMVLVDDGVVYLRAKGITRGARYLPWPWRIGYAFFFLPAWLTDLLYGIVARTRYRLFGKKEVCRIPEAHERERLLP